MYTLERIVRDRFHTRLVGHLHGFLIYLYLYLSCLEKWGILFDGYLSFSFLSLIWKAGVRLPHSLGTGRIPF